MKIDTLFSESASLQKSFEKTVEENNKKKDDVHHCCGRYIKTKADRHHHNEIYHATLVVKVTYNP